MAVFFTSDTHFGDHRTLNLYKRPFASIGEMDEALVANWNAVVAPDDVVWHLGDFARTARRAAEILPRLNGEKHLVTGNNDPPFAAGDGWASVQPYAETEVGEVRLVLCHYPFRSWNGQHRGALNLHGHSHGRMKPLPRQFDVGVDVRNYRPVTLAELTARTPPGNR
ncbi:metallophosphoesterase family protein [Phenylobacterium sp.]|jgi:calcineurin-like phosphoesterase family protein|uniref:metallophosphoesterase family protein n=1 Tax=Phenylobacterium sp. TaxID=1871053 RepID=UPI002E32F1EA|nr:metallophosphoesterase family protein [Phenylobacterium sp.]HEX2559701.1 metallophosphoesterase family protein [Phenylobacterium sp.]